MQENLSHIIHQIQLGDKVAFRLLVEQYQQQVYAMAFRILCDEDEARDAVQECLIRVWKNIGSYNPEKNFKNWIFRILTNIAIDRLRSIKRLKHVAIDQVGDLEGFNQDRKMDNEEVARWIRLLADDLPEKQRLVFILRDVQGMESQEVEYLLNINETQVKSNLYHARKAIRTKLNKIMV